MKPVRLSPGEVLWLNRRKDGHSMATMAALHGVSEDVYREWEHDRRDDVPRGKRIRSMTPGDYSALMRRREGLTLPEVAALRRTTRVTICKQERDRTKTAPDLAAWWQVRVRENPLLSRPGKVSSSE